MAVVSEKIVAGIHEAFRAEHFATSFCFQCAYSITGIPNYKVYHEYFKDCFKSELNHMKKLAKKLHGLLENIDIPNASVPNFDKLEDMLEYQYGIEMDAIELYSKLADMAEQEKNTPFMEFFAGLAKEEEDDREAIAKRLGRVPSKYSKVSISIGDKP